MKTGADSLSETIASNRRGFVTTALGTAVFAAGMPSRAQTTGAKQANATRENKKVFIAMPGEVYFAIPEEALQQYRVDSKQFEAELSRQKEFKSFNIPRSPKNPKEPGPIVIHNPQTVLGVRG